MIGEILIDPVSNDPKGENVKSKNPFVKIIISGKTTDQ